MLSPASFTAEDLYLDGIARFAGPDDVNFAILTRDDRNTKPSVLFRLGLHYLHGYGCKANEGTALGHFTMASKRGLGSASYCLYRIYSKRISHDVALTHLLKAVEQNHKFAQQVLMRDHADFVEELFRKSVDDIKHDMHQHVLDNAILNLTILGECGHTEALFELMINRCGTPEQLFAWSLKAARMGHLNAMYHTAYMYMGGKGVQKNRKEGHDWHRKAAEAGHEGSAKFIRVLESTQN